MKHQIPPIDLVTSEASLVTRVTSAYVSLKPHKLPNSIPFCLFVYRFVVYFTVFYCIFLFCTVFCNIIYLTLSPKKKK